MRLVFAAVALPVLGWAENLGAEKPVTFRLEGAVVDGFRLFDLARVTMSGFFAATRVVYGSQLKEVGSLGFSYKLNMLSKGGLLQQVWGLVGTAMGDEDASIN